MWESNVLKSVIPVVEKAALVHVNEEKICEAGWFFALRFRQRRELLDGSDPCHECIELRLY